MNKNILKTSLFLLYLSGVTATFGAKQQKQQKQNREEEQVPKTALGQSLVKKIQAKQKVKSLIQVTERQKAQMYTLSKKTSVISGELYTLFESLSKVDRVIELLNDQNVTVYFSVKDNNTLDSKDENARAVLYERITREFELNDKYELSKKESEVMLVSKNGKFEYEKRGTDSIDRIAGKFGEGKNKKKKKIKKALKDLSEVIKNNNADLFQGVFQKTEEEEEEEEEEEDDDDDDDDEDDEDGDNNDEQNNNNHKIITWINKFPKKKSSSGGKASKIDFKGFNLKKDDEQEEEQDNQQEKPIDKKFIDGINMLIKLKGEANGSNDKKEELLTELDEYVEFLIKLDNKSKYKQVSKEAKDQMVKDLQKTSEELFLRYKSDPTIKLIGDSATYEEERRNREIAIKVNNDIGAMSLKQCLKLVYYSHISKDIDGDFEVGEYGYTLERKKGFKLQKQLEALQTNIDSHDDVGKLGWIEWFFYQILPPLPSWLLDLEGIKERSAVYYSKYEIENHEKFAEKLTKYNNEQAQAVDWDAELVVNAIAKTKVVAPIVLNVREAYKGVEGNPGKYKQKYKYEGKYPIVKYGMWLAWVLGGVSAVNYFWVKYLGDDNDDYEYGDDDYYDDEYGYDEDYDDEGDDDEYDDEYGYEGDDDEYGYEGDDDDEYGDEGDDDE